VNEGSEPKEAESPDLVEKRLETHQGEMDRAAERQKAEKVAAEDAATEEAR